MTSTAFEGIVFLSKDQVDEIERTREIPESLLVDSKKSKKSKNKSSSSSSSEAALSALVNS